MNHIWTEILNRFKDSFRLIDVTKWEVMAIWRIWFPETDYLDLIVMLHRIKLSLYVGLGDLGIVG